MKETVNCAVDCVSGCVLGDDCPNQEYAGAATQFIQDTPLDKMIEIAEIARRKKLTQTPKWIVPDDL